MHTHLEGYLTILTYSNSVKYTRYCHLNDNTDDYQYHDPIRKNGGKFCGDSDLPTGTFKITIQNDYDVAEIMQLRQTL